MMEVSRKALLERVRHQAKLSASTREFRLRRLPFRLIPPRLFDAAGMALPVTAQTFFGRNMLVHLPAQ
jgi:hypothetical protein